MFVFLFCRCGFVRADRVLHLRELLDKLSSTAGLINEEKGRCLILPGLPRKRSCSLKGEIPSTCKSFLKLKTG